ncbi:aldo/keto reductase [Streptomyces europaeiscabiei]|uniref:aldo/keto reductase n=1 Tax=Streptomyces europaeiscabiei TaxID=146819 RepID=UPI002E0E8220|nr:aldo/keto reductase [Streptomyces europaeiscabiei]
MTVASLGLGTYRVHASALSDAVVRAAADPVTSWVDTAPNYLDGQAQSLLAPVLARYPIPVSTKVGFLTDQTAKAALADRALTNCDAEGRHCLSAPYVHWQCARNRTELGRDHLDVVFAHNPEQAPGDPYEALRDAFTALEAEAAAGTMNTYGVATWDGFDSGALSIPALDQLATEAAGSAQHHLRAIQLPVSLVTATAFAQALDEKGPIAEAARLGWQVVASAPLFGGELPQLATHELTALVRPSFTIPQACLLATASCPGVTRILLSASTSAHWVEAQAALQEPAIPVPTCERYWMYSPPIDPADHHRVQDAFTGSVKALGVTVDGPEVWDWHGRTLSGRVQHPDQGLCWLRLLTAPQDKASGKIWDGNRAAAALFDRNIRKPALYDTIEEVSDSYVYQAELHQYVDEPVCSRSPVLRTDLAPPAAWWNSLRTDLEYVNSATTDRVAVRQEWADRTVPRFLGRPAPRITEWAVAHGDLHPANLTAATPFLLDWEGFGLAPAGYDAAMLLAYSLLAPGFAQRVRDTFPVLRTEAGHVAQLIVITELLQSASRGDHPDLVPALRKLATDVSGERTSRV